MKNNWHKQFDELESTEYLNYTAYDEIKQFIETLLKEIRIDAIKEVREELMQYTQMDSEDVKEFDKFLKHLFTNP